MLQFLKLISRQLSPYLRYERKARRCLVMSAQSVSVQREPQYFLQHPIILAVSIPFRGNLQLHLQAETDRPSEKVMDAGLASGDIYIHSHPKPAYRHRTLTSHWLRPVQGTVWGQRSRCLSVGRSGWLSEPVLLSSTIVGDRGHSLPSAESLLARTQTHSRICSHRFHILSFISV